MSGSYYFAIVAHNDNPIFEMDYVNTNKEIKVGILFTKKSPLFKKYF